MDDFDDIYDSDNFSLWEAIADHNQGRLRRELRNPDLNMNYVFPNNMSFLHLAVKYNNHVAIEMLVAHGIDVNINTVGTPLHLAIALSLHEVVELLVQLGADVNLTDRQGYAPLFIATVFKNMAITKCLIDNGAIIDSWNPERPSDYLRDYAF